MNKNVPSYEKWRQLATESATTALIITDESLLILWHNEAVVNLLGPGLSSTIKITEFIEHSEYLMRAIIGEVYDRRRCVINQTTVTPPFDSDGFTARVIASPIYEPDSSSTLIEIIQTDNTQIQGLMSHSTSNDAMSVVRNLAHELKNPLGGIKGAAQLLKQEEGDSDISDIIVREVNRLSGIIDRLLYGKANNLYQTRLNIHKPIDHASRILETNFPSIVVERDYDPSIPDLIADEDLLVQLILNLFQNAAQAINGSGTITVKTRIERNVIVDKKSNRYVVRVDIIDEGCGIPAAIQDKIFIPMVSGRHEGAGLGLSICMDIVNAHKGLLTFKSNPGKTQFSIFLPIEA